MPIAAYTFAFLCMNVAQETMWFTAFRQIFPSKLSLLHYYTLVVALNIGISLLAFYPLAPYTEIRIALFNSLYALFLILLHRGKPLPKLLGVLSIFITIALTEMTMFLLAPEFSLRTQHRDLCHPKLILFYAAFLVTQAFYLLLLVRGFHFFGKKNKTSFSDRDGLYYVLVPINQFVLLSIWFYHYIFTAPEDSFTPGKFIGVAVIIIFSVLTDVLLFHLIDRTAENARLRARNELIEEQIAVKAECSRLNAQTYSDMRRMRHDITNHICTIHAMLRNGEKDAAQRYVAGLEKTDTVRSLLSDCQNTAVDAFLQERAEGFAAEHISLSMDIHLSPSCFVSDVDLITALGNLLDNAADACKESADPYIQLKIRLADGFLHIETENPYSTAGRKKERRISYMNRGIGTGILNALAEKYDGNFTSRANGSIYNNILVLKEPTPHG